jgi:murein L,D-transpeptidase YcbB/YkuD
MSLRYSGLLLLFVSGCNFFGAGRAWSGISAEALRAPIHARVQNGERPERLAEHQWNHVKSLYAASDSRPLWVGERGLREQTLVLLDAISTAPNEALRLDAYPLQDLQRTLARLRGNRRPSAAQLAEVDVLFTSAYAAYGEDLLAGQIDPRSVAQSWHIDPREENVDSTLLQALREEDFGQALARLRPGGGYEFLRRELARYRQIVSAGGWGTIPEGEALKPGDIAQLERMRRLLQRLHAEGLAREIRIPAADDTAAARGLIYDAALAGAVARFQERHGIVPDSVLGGETVETLNKPADFRLRQVAANLERHRWLPRTLGTQYVLVNVPAFQLDVYERGTSVLSMKVVVGAEYQGKATPVFSDSISFLVFRPYWNVPDNIAERDLWPRLRADPGYFARNNYEVVSGGGRTYVRQRPGSRNALGDVKFMFPNDFAIYLHDTPADELFDRTVRGYSSGCIRLEKPDELALYLLRPQGWDMQRVRATMEGGPLDSQVTLERKVPVFIVYFTAFERDGELLFGNDLYERDSRIIETMASAVVPGQEAVHAAQAARALARQFTRG